MNQFFNRHIMKNFYILLFFLAFSGKLASQIYDPYIDATNANYVLPKSPWGPVGTLGSGTFELGNNGPQSMSYWDTCGTGFGCKLIVQISPNTLYTVFGDAIIGGADPTGTMASKFDWTYDSFDGSLTGVQIADIASGESGTITFPLKHIAISTEVNTSPCNGDPNGNCFGTQVGGIFRGFNGYVVNVLPPSFPPNNNQNVTNDNLGGYEYTLTSLPLENLIFNAKMIADKKVQLNWVTSNELNRKEFEIERYDAGSKSWSYIGKKPAAGIFSAKAEYSYIDPLTGFNAPKAYYRIKSVNLNGTHEFTPVRAVNLSLQNFTLNSYPNPFKNSFALEVNSTKEGPADLKIIDILGRVVHTEKLTINTGLNSKTIRMDNAPDGSYSIQLAFEEVQYVIKTLKVN